MGAQDKKTSRGDTLSKYSSATTKRKQNNKGVIDKR
jgi:hypothetical protein